METLYDIDCFQRILDHFMLMDQAAAPSSPCIVEEGQSMEGDPHSLTSITMVANLVDVYLADVAPDVNLKFLKFQLLAAAVPDYARPLADGMYRAIDIYLKVKESHIIHKISQKLCIAKGTMKLKIRVLEERY